MLSRPPASLAAAISSRPACVERPARRAIIGFTRASRTIEVRPSEQTRNRSPARAWYVVRRRPRRRLGAERARDDRALRVRLGLLLGELAARHELADERVVLRSAGSARRRARR